MTFYTQCTDNAKKKVKHTLQLCQLNFFLLQNINNFYFGIRCRMLCCRSFLTWRWWWCLLRVLDAVDSSRTEIHKGENQSLSLYYIDITITLLKLYQLYHAHDLCERLQLNIKQDEGFQIREHLTYDAVEQLFHCETTTLKLSWRDKMHNMSIGDMRMDGCEDCCRFSGCLVCLKACPAGKRRFTPMSDG